MKVVDEASAAKCVLDEVVKRAECVRTHLRYFNIVSVGRYYLNWRKGLQFSKSTGAVLLYVEFLLRTSSVKILYHSDESVSC
jgi:hypothetical protein